MRELLYNAAGRLKLARAEALVIYNNTMHRLAPAIEEHTGLPMLHIASLTERAISNAGHSRVGLLATRYTMEQDFESPVSPTTSDWRC
jgi:aspartate racemase